MAALPALTAFGVTTYAPAAHAADAKPAAEKAPAAKPAAGKGTPAAKPAADKGAPAAATKAPDKKTRDAARKAYGEGEKAFNAGKYDDALRYATVATEEMRDRPEAQDTLGYIYLQKDLPVHALPAFERAVQMAPQNALYRQHLQQAQAKAKMADKAEKAVNR